MQLSLGIQLDLWVSFSLDFKSISNSNPLLTLEQMAQYAKAIHKAGAPLATVWAFIDCTIWSICRPSQYQQQAYNGYKGKHSLNYQGLKLADGMIGALFGPVEGR